MAMNVVICNLKGGVGKTTTTVYLAAAAAAEYEPVVVIDTDRQASAAEWLDERPIEGVSLVEAPSERTAVRAMASHNGLAFVDTAAGDQRLTNAAVSAADVAVIPTRAGGVEYGRVAATLDLIDKRIPVGLVICSARLGTNDLEAAIAWWNDQHIPIWDIIPERVGIASGPEAHLYREGLDAYGEVLKKVLRSI